MFAAVVPLSDVFFFFEDLCVFTSESTAVRALDSLSGIDLPSPCRCRSRCFLSACDRLCACRCCGGREVRRVWLSVCGGRPGDPGLLSS